jgi:hypothetical protein
VAKGQEIPERSHADTWHIFGPERRQGRGEGFQLLPVFGIGRAVVSGSAAQRFITDCDGTFAGRQGDEIQGVVARFKAVVRKPQILDQSGGQAIEGLGQRGVKSREKFPVRRQSTELVVGFE